MLRSRPDHFNSRRPKQCIFLWTTNEGASAFRRPDAILLRLSERPIRSCSMALLNTVYMKFRAFIRFIERTDEEFLAGEAEDR